MTQDGKTNTPTKTFGGALGRLFGRNEHEAFASDDKKPPVVASELPLADIQGFILRGYRMPMARHLLLTVGVPAEARKLLGRFISGDESDAPQITTAKDWHVGFAPAPADNPADAPRLKPDYCLNLGITWPGFIALEIKDRVPALSFTSFDAFVAGAAERAELVGDTGPSAPQNWVGDFGKGRDHVLVTLHALSPEAMQSYTERLSALFAGGTAFKEIRRQDGMAWIRIVDLHPDVAKLLSNSIADRKSGYILCTSNEKPLGQSNILRRSLRPILEKLGINRCGFHAFRRFRNTYLRNYTSCPNGLRNFWLGWSDEDMSDHYDKIRKDAAFRREVAERVGIGFDLPEPSIVPSAGNVPTSSEQVELAT